MASTTMRGALKAALVLCVFAAFWNGGCSTSEPVQHPGIQATPAAISFSDTMGAAVPGPQTVSISADGPGTLTGLRASVDFGGGTSGWLTVTLSDTTAPATLTVTPSNTGLSVATYHATVVLTAANAPNSPLNVPIAFDLAAAPVPSIVISPANVTVADTIGTPPSASQALAITGNGQGTLTGLKATVDYGSGPSGWLTATLSDTTAPATLTIRSSSTTMAASTYHATVSVTAPGSPNSPQAVPVTFNLSPQPPIQGITIAAVGNLGRCGGDMGKQSELIVAAMNPPPDYIFMLGDNADPANGTLTTLQDYQNCYDPVWGQWKSKTYAVLGNHEVDTDTIPPAYGTGMASGADAYFGPDHVGPPGKNWYSFDIGAWHIIALNVQSPGGYTRPINIQYHAGSDQLNWLDSDLSNHSNKCTLAFFYQAMWYSASSMNPKWRPYIFHGGRDTLYKDGYRIQDIRGIWTELYNHNADVVVNGTPHIYERFDNVFYANGYQSPTDSEYAVDPVRGIRQLTSGLGGDGPLVADTAVIRLAASKYRSGGNGVLKLVLGNGEYTWEFLNTRYSHIQDSGRGTCH
ncbi:MAG TPA: hypothetical protein VL549_16110 [Gemmatimonadales bacterium]|nr:hypothetical protein [Gemmatimonadales bacterium]